MMPQTNVCSHENASLNVERDPMMNNSYACVKRCTDCGDEIDRTILGPSSKYKEWTDEKLLKQF